MRGLDPWPVNAEKLETVAAVLDKAGYTSTNCYLADAVTEGDATGQPHTEDGRRILKLIRRASARDKNPPKSAAGFTIDMLKDAQLHLARKGVDLKVW